MAKSSAFVNTKALILKISPDERALSCLHLTIEIYYKVACFRYMLRNTALLLYLLFLFFTRFMNSS